MNKRTIFKSLLIMSVTGMAGGCTVERTPHLFPSNDIAAKTGVLEGTIIGHGNLHGVMKVGFLDGETLDGDIPL